MSTHIQWTDETWNPVTGCTRVSEGCDRCYIERQTPMRIAGRKFDRSGIGGTTGLVLHPERLLQPLRWRKPRRVFVNSMSDLFHEDVPDALISDVFAVMAATPHHTYQILTKRPARMRSLLASEDFDLAVAEKWSKLDTTAGSLAEDHTPPYPLPNLWLGVSVENQKWAHLRIPALLDTPAAVRFVSAEPLLGPLDLSRFLEDDPERYDVPPVDWLIVGGESGPGARPMHPDWARSLRDQCTAAGVPFFMKQWGEFRPLQAGDRIPDERMVGVERGDDPHLPWPRFMLRVGKKAAGRELDGRTWDEFPEVKG